MVPSYNYRRCYTVLFCVKIAPNRVSLSRYKKFHSLVQQLGLPTCDLASNK